MSGPDECAYIEAVLLGEAPFPEGDDDAFYAKVAQCPSCSELSAALAQIDTLAAELPELTVPAALSERTLQAVLDEMPPERATPVRPPRRQRWPFAVLVGGLAAASALVVMQPSGPSPAPPERLVARGSGDALPSVALKVAVDSGQGLERHRRDAAYRSGTRVQFRVTLDRPADVALVRVDSTSAKVVTTGTLAAGDSDLKMGPHPLAWEVEPGESDARFVLLAAPAGGLPADPASGLAFDPATIAAPAGSVCATVGHLACDERLLRIQP